MSAEATLLTGEALAVLRTLPEASARCCVTSPPYFGLRDYGEPEQLGLEPTPEAYVARLVGILREVRRVLTDDGTLFLNLGDSYAAQRGGTNMPAETLAGGEGGKGDAEAYRGRPGGPSDERKTCHSQYMPSRFASRIGLKHKDLIGTPWRVAFALQADGWYLRSDIIWHKPNPMPESVTDRPTKAHEYLFLLAKSERYYYDAAAIAEEAESIGRIPGGGNKTAADGNDGDRNTRALCLAPVGATRNARSVWTIATRPYSGAHFATMPAELARRCIMAGSAPGDTVLDPFGGSGTTAATAVGCGRNAVHIELNPAYQALARERIGPMFCRGAA